MLFHPATKSMLVSLVCVRDKTANKDNRQQMTAEKNVMKMFCWLGRLGWREFEKKMRLNSLSILRSSTTAEWFIIHEISTENQMSWRRILNIYGGVKRRYSNEFIEHILIFDYSWVSQRLHHPQQQPKNHIGSEKAMNNWFKDSTKVFSLKFHSNFSSSRTNPSTMLDIFCLFLEPCKKYQMIIKFLSLQRVSPVYGLNRSH